MFWWPMLDQIDWDGAMTHRIGKIHEVGLYSLRRQPDGALARVPTPLVNQCKEVVAAGEKLIGRLEEIAIPSLEAEAEQLPPLGEWIQPTIQTAAHAANVAAQPSAREGSNGGNGHSVIADATVRGGRSVDP